MHGLAKSEIQQAQQEHLEVYKRLVDSIGEGFVIYSKKPDTGELTYLSARFESVFGIPKDDAINQTWGSVINWLPEDKEKANNINARFFIDENRQAEDILRFIHPDGHQRTVRVSDYPALDGAGDPPIGPLPHHRQPGNRF